MFSFSPTWARTTPLGGSFPQAHHGARRRATTVTRAAPTAAMISSHRECMAFTNGVVGDYLNELKSRERWMSTFLKFERSLVGYETDWPERHRIWQSVLFYNYLQVAMGGPRKAGTDAEYRQASRPTSACSTNTDHSISSPGATEVLN